ncbi:hypothetical protein D3C83_134050 [compost metagenome]
MPATAMAAITMPSGLSRARKAMTMPLKVALAPMNWVSRYSVPATIRPPANPDRAPDNSTTPTMVAVTGNPAERAVSGL